MKLGLSLMKLAFSLESWEACGGDSSMSGDEALDEGNHHIDAALRIFDEVSTHAPVAGSSGGGFATCTHMYH